MSDAAAGNKRPRPKGTTLTFEPPHSTPAGDGSRSWLASPAASTAGGAAGLVSRPPHGAPRRADEQAHVNAGATCYALSSLETVLAPLTGVVEVIDASALLAASVHGAELASFFPVYTMLRELYNRYARMQHVDLAFLDSLDAAVRCYRLEFDAESQDHAGLFFRALLAALRLELQYGIPFLSVSLPCMPRVATSVAPCSCAMAVAMRLAALVVPLLPAGHAHAVLDAISAGTEPAKAPLHVILLSAPIPGEAAFEGAAAVEAGEASVGLASVSTARTAAEHCARILRFVFSAGDSSADVAGAAAGAEATVPLESCHMATYIRKEQASLATPLPTLLDVGLRALAYALDRADSDAPSDQLRAWQEEAPDDVEADLDDNGVLESALPGARDAPGVRALSRATLVATCTGPAAAGLAALLSAPDLEGGALAALADELSPSDWDVVLAAASAHVLPLLKRSRPEGLSEDVKDDDVAAIAAGTLPALALTRLSTLLHALSQSCVHAPPAMLVPMAAGLLSFPLQRRVLPNNAPELGLLDAVIDLCVGIVGQGHIGFDTLDQVFGVVLSAVSVSERKQNCDTELSRRVRWLPPLARLVDTIDFEDASAVQFAERVSHVASLWQLQVTPGGSDFIRCVSRAIPHHVLLKPRVELLYKTPISNLPPNLLSASLTRSRRCPHCLAWVACPVVETDEVIPLDLPALPVPRPLDFAHTLEGLLSAELFALRELREEYACSACLDGKVRQRAWGASESNLLSVSPVVLGLDLKRCYLVNGRPVLRPDAVKFPLELNLRPYSVSGRDAWYDLRSLTSYLSSNGGATGHYVSYVKGHPFVPAGDWCLLNDAKPTHVTVDDVLFQRRTGGLASKPCVVQLCYFRRRPAAGAAPVTVVELSDSDSDA